MIVILFELKPDVLLILPYKGKVQYRNQDSCYLLYLVTKFYGSILPHFREMWV